MVGRVHLPALPADPQGTQRQARHSAMVLNVLAHCSVALPACALTAVANSDLVCSSFGYQPQQAYRLCSLRL